jgi:hypothetical protein
VEEDKVMLAARRCILAQDQALYWADSEIAYLRWKWDLQEASRHNYHHLCYLGGLVYEERDRAARTRTA